MTKVFVEQPLALPGCVKYWGSEIYRPCGSLFLPCVTALYTNIKNNKTNKNPTGCLMVMADLTDLGHGEKKEKQWELKTCEVLFSSYWFFLVLQRVSDMTI